MTSMRRWAVVVFWIVVLMLVAGPVLNLLRRPSATPLTEGPTDDPVTAKAMAVLEANCLDCHCQATQKPYYAALPVIGPIVEADIQRGRYFIDLVEAFTPHANRLPSPAALAKLEYVITHDQMPPRRYRLAHWNTWLSETDKRALLDWVDQVRSRYAPDSRAPGQAPPGPIQPLPKQLPVDARKAVLGKLLYHDKRLSGDGTIACASCHDLATGGVDRKPVSTGIDGKQGPINAPTVFNAVFNIDQFWDGRADDLAEQAGGPVTNPLEMGADWRQVIERLRKDESLVSQFQALYPDGLTRHTITDAIAEFEKTLITPDSPFDRYLRGDQQAMSPAAVRGYRLFLEHRCATCHVGPAMGGQSYEPMGLWRAYFDADRPVQPADLGRFNVTGLQRDRHRFKVPTLRNVALTWPYFHDGSAETLEQAVKVMAQYQTDRPLDRDQIADLVAFLKACTGCYEGKPLAEASPASQNGGAS